MSTFHVPSLWRSGERPGPKLVEGLDPPPGARATAKSGDLSMILS